MTEDTQTQTTTASSPLSTQHCCCIFFAFQFILCLICPACADQTCQLRINISGSSERDDRSNCSRRPHDCQKKKWLPFCRRCVITGILCVWSKMSPISNLHPSDCTPTLTNCAPLCHTSPLRAHCRCSFCSSCPFFYCTPEVSSVLLELEVALRLDDFRRSRRLRSREPKFFFFFFEASSSVLLLAAFDLDFPLFSSSSGFFERRCQYGLSSAASARYLAETSSQWRSNEMSIDQSAHMSQHNTETICVVVCLCCMRIYSSENNTWKR